MKFVGRTGVILKASFLSLTLKEQIKNMLKIQMIKENIPIPLYLVSSLILLSNNIIDRPVDVLVKDIAVCPDGLGFDFRASQISRKQLATLCCPGAKPRRLASLHASA